MNDATRRQIAAARPDRSTWLSANAGSGKTRVLIDRVARLLLGGASPQNVLCLTYTKAAASEMQNRLFKTLGGWAMLPEDDLRTALEDLTGGAHVPEARLREARRLFAKAVETPGGLRIQTIHSFCAILLRKFPLEAGVSPQFTEMDDRSAALLREECLEDMAERDPGVLLDMARVLNGGDMGKFVEALAAARDSFGGAVDETRLRAILDLPPGLAVDDLVADVFGPGDPALVHRVAAAMAAHGGKQDQKAAPDLASVTADAVGVEMLEAHLLYGASAKAGPFSAKIGKFPSAASRGVLDSEDADALDDLMGRVEAARGTRLALAALQRNVTLHRFAAAYLPIYARAKADRGWLDFDDLILKARDLLSVGDAAQWVLYRLDGGIDHILVDEAQDTAPAQWQMIETLAREAAAGDGTAKAGARTIFVVGDKKQSIYSFQGADPEGFDRMFERFGRQAGQDGIARLDMLHSFRSSPAILSAVDRTFAGDGMTHIAFHDGLPGRVDLWPLLTQDAACQTPDFDDPVDMMSPEDANVRLARKIARRIARMIGVESIPDPEKPGAFRRIKAGDILILFRRRKALFDATIRACKAAGIPMAGADRLTVGADLAVRDIRALLAFLATPEDSLSLAAALKSPLFGWDEQALFDLAARRGERHLWEALRGRAGEFPDTMRMLDDLRTQAGFLRPFELIERILTRHEGRARLIGRLGRESIEAIDALLSQAMVYERTEIPSLTGFLGWLEGDDIEIKRQSEGLGTDLRVMTVHGAKGLEAPIVILPETMMKPQTDPGRFWQVAETRVLTESAAGIPPALQEARDRVRANEAAERDRLLYVAMTRAQFWLIVAGAGDEAEAAGRWYGQVQQGMEGLECRRIDDPVGALRYEVGDWADSTTPIPPEDAGDTDAPALPRWIDRDAPPVKDNPPPVPPSGLGGAKILPSEPLHDPVAQAEALDRGTHLHALLEHLPPDRPEDWPALARRVLPLLDDTARDDRLREAAAVLRHDDLADIFAGPAMAEVGIAAALPSGARILGTIDRLIVTPERVLAIDYKSNRAVPEDPEDVPEGLLRQMGAYDHALSRIYPDHGVEVAILWTATAELMPLPPALIRAAFGRAVDLDAPPGAA